MKTLIIHKKKFDEEILKRSFAEERDCENEVQGHFIIKDAETGHIVAVNAPIENKTMSDGLRQAMMSLKNWTVASRGSGLKTTAKVFGYQPRSPIRQRPFCHRGVLAKEQPRVHDLISAFSLCAQEVFKMHVPEDFEKQVRLLHQKVKPEWRMSGSIYTSGICNNNNALGYHRDRGNFEDFWSAMAVFRKDISGGNLIVKDYDVKINFTDNSLFFFNGQKWWHGVTPITKTALNGYRYSIVYYALKEMWKCMSQEDELKYAIKTRQETEMKRAGMLK